MPMLITLRIRFPVWPFHAPLRMRFEKEPNFRATSVHYDLAALLALAQELS